MNDSTRNPHTEPEGQGDQSAGTGWSTPQHGTSQPQSAPWSQESHDTGSVPRPNDTRQFVAGGTGETVRTGTEPASQASGPSSLPPSSTMPPSGGGRVGGYGAGDTSPYGGVPPYGGNPTSTDPPPSKGRRGTALIAALALGAGLVGGAAGAGIVSYLDEDDATSPASSFDNQATEAADLPDGSSVEQVANTVTPSVVSIGIEGPRGSGSGSGVVISSDGQILTNAHVAAAGEEGTLTVTFHDGSDAQAEVVGLDEDSDVAVLQAEGVSDLEPAQLGDSDNLSVGSNVVAVGSPLGLDGTVTKGIVSALHRPVSARDSQQAALFEAIQTDASINPGNSGGPLVNSSGQVVGINTAIAAAPGTQGSIGLGFAIPINTASYIAEQIVDGGEIEYARIGIGVSDGEGQERQATVEEVQEGGAADETGLESGDVVTHIDGRYMSDARSLVAAARAYEPGDEITLTFVRDGEEQTVELTLGTSANDDA